MSELATEGVRNFFDGNEIKEVLADTFYQTEKKAQPKKAAKTKPDHYGVICISLYNEDLAALDAKVKGLKKAGHRKMSRSALIRYALDTVNLDNLPRSY